MTTYLVRNDFQDMLYFGTLAIYHLTYAGSILLHRVSNDLMKKNLWYGRAITANAGDCDLQYINKQLKQQGEGEIKKKTRVPREMNLLNHGLLRFPVWEWSQTKTCLR